MNCVFGIFDVLGFTSFCENCEPHAAEKVLKIIDDFETEIPRLVWQHFDPANQAPQDKKDMVTSRLRWLTFSDTVFVAMPLEADDQPDTVKFNLIFFTMLVAYINRRMFEIGLPMRGAIHVGEVTVSRRCFAGKAIVEAHRLSEKVQVATTVVSEAANAFFIQTCPSGTGLNTFFKSAVIECDLPTKTSGMERIKTLCWFFLHLGHLPPFIIPADLKVYITEKFTEHGKVLVDEAKNKVANTEKLFRDWIAVNKLDYHELSLKFPPTSPSLNPKV
jgi:hypothetical protein